MKSVEYYNRINSELNKWDAERSEAHNAHMRELDSFDEQLKAAGNDTGKMMSVLSKMTAATQAYGKKSQEIWNRFPSSRI